jgi:exopolyphosphatase/guanosine-5'-triphosphate,3'-diphosphate pyrophosphatase
LFADPTSLAGPTRVAVIDIGTNSTRLLIAEVSGNTVVELERISTVTRLGRGVDHSGQLSDEAIEDTCAVIGDYLEKIAGGQVEKSLAVATSAVRDASNGSVFAAELRERFALDLLILSGDQEAWMTYRGAISDRDGEENLLVVDIGGGSTELVVGRGPSPLFHTSLQAGVVRHTERLLTSDPPETGDLESLAGDIHRLIGEALEGQDLPGIETAVGVAGTPSSLAAIDLELDPYDPAAVEGHTLDLGTVQTWLSRLASLPLEERKQVTGLHPDRAQPVVAGLVILIEVMRAFDLDRIEVSEHDLLYGLALTAARDEAP